MLTEQFKATKSLASSIFFYVDPNLTLVIPTAVFNITEPDEGEVANVTACFEAGVDIPRRRDADFELILSNLTTANSTEFIPSSALRVRMDFSGFFNSCVDFIILGDDLVESDEVIIVDIRPLSDRDRVQFSDGSDSLTVNIIDNDGTYVHACMYEPV